MKRKLGTMMVGAKRQVKAGDEHYDTPAAGTVAFMQAEEDFIQAHGDAVWECCCGTGAMARVIESFGFRVRATTLVDRGYGTALIDFLKTDSLTGRRWHGAVITNPPFSRADEMIRHALGRLNLPYFALLLPSTFWQATADARRDALQREFPPSLFLPLGFRLDFEGKGSPVMSCTWTVWDRNRPGRADYVKTTPALPRPVLFGGI